MDSNHESVVIPSAFGSFSSDALLGFRSVDGGPGVLKWIPHAA